MTLLVQITDTHILPSGDMLYGNTDTAAHLAESIRQINAMRPKPGVVLITGDLSSVSWKCQPMLFQVTMMIRM